MLGIIKIGLQGWRLDIAREAFTCCKKEAMGNLLIEVGTECFEDTVLPDVGKQNSRFIILVLAMAQRLGE